MSANDLGSFRALGSSRALGSFRALRSGLVAGVLLSVGLAGCTRTGSEELPSPTGEDRACTQIGCVNGFRISLDPGSDMAAGAYRFEVDIDGALTTCEGNLPLAACEAGPSITCSSDAVSIGESGCAMEPASQGFGEVLFANPRNPKAVKLTVSRDGEVIGAGEFTPEYERVQPNGPDCEPTCEYAEATLELAGPPS